MQTENKSPVNEFQLREAISDATRRLEKVEALLNCLSNEYFDWNGKIDVKTIADFVSNGMDRASAEEERRACDWVNGFSQIQNMFEIIDDYVLEAKRVLLATDNGGQARVLK